MTVSFVAPQWSQVLHYAKEDLYFRVLSGTGEKFIIYQLPALEDVLKLAHISSSEYDELCERYQKWQSGDKSITPVLANGLIAGGVQANSPDDPAPRYLRRELPRKIKPAKPVKINLPRSKRAKAAVLAAAAQSQPEPEPVITPLPDSWQVRDDKALLAAYKDYCERYELFLDDWRIFEVEPRAQTENENVLCCEDLRPVADPFAPLLRTTQNELEATKVQALASLVADLDIVAIGIMILRYQEPFWSNIALNLEVPSGFAQYLLHLWCIFGATPEGLVYAKECLTEDDGPTSQAPQIFSWMQSPAYRSTDHWIYQSFWTSMYQLMFAKYLFEHAQEALALQGKWSQAMLPMLWDQGICEQFGAKIITAFGGPKHSFLWQFKHSARFAPDNFASNEISRVLKPIFDEYIQRNGDLLTAEEMERFGINPFYTREPKPLPHKDDFVFDAATRTQLLTKLEPNCMSMVLEKAAQALDRDFYPESLVMFTKPERGCFMVTSGCSLANLSLVSTRQPAHKQIVPVFVRYLSEHNLVPKLRGGLACTLTEPDLDAVSVLAVLGIARFVYGVADPKSGAFSTGAFAKLGIKLEFSAGIRAQECQHLIDLYHIKHPIKKRPATRKKPVSTSQAKAELAAFARQVEQEFAAKQAAETKPAAKKAAGTKSPAKESAVKKPAAKKAAASETESAPAKRARRRTADQQ